MGVQQHESAKSRFISPPFRQHDYIPSRSAGIASRIPRFCMRAGLPRTSPKLSPRIPQSAGCIASACSAERDLIFTPKQPSPAGDLGHIKKVHRICVKSTRLCVVPFGRYLRKKTSTAVRPRKWRIPLCSNDAGITRCLVFTEEY